MCRVYLRLQLERAWLRWFAQSMRRCVALRRGCKKYYVMLKCKLMRPRFGRWKYHAQEEERLRLEKMERERLAAEAREKAQRALELRIALRGVRTRSH